MTRTRLPRLLLALTAALALAGCASATADPGPAAAGTGTGINLTPQQNRISTPKVDSIAALVPADVRAHGTLEVVDSLGTVPPLDFYATDDKTVIGAEPDLATLVADVLGLKVQFHPESWENVFVGLDSGKYDVGFTNITVTETRKEKYDFATYRLDNLAFEAKKGADWKVTGPRDVAGRTIGVSSGTNQEKLLLDWSAQDVAAGLKPVKIAYYQNSSDYYLALGSGRIDAWVGPNPTSAFHAAQTGQTQVIGTYSGAGASLQGKIAATVKKGNPLITAVQAALDEVIRNGTYGQVLQRWGLANEAVPSSELNPPGLPKSDG
ncbi:ABC transporter substrate-binding protein [Kitasatospora sp. NBC_01302]|uniref:ABC transporter substrate-binding protein n=1 Tax=Kitasatospora sp. NBC_01302 TaxID=2903575 RepID=UPI002E0E01F9|nr:ABC transporter substrate-binding protein [Kitasatospora sp. NBC_01302]